MRAASTSPIEAAMVSISRILRRNIADVARIDEDADCHRQVFS